MKYNYHIQSTYNWGLPQGPRLGHMHKQNKIETEDDHKHENRKQMSTENHPPNDR